jgi:hypothetical protein
VNKWLIGMLSFWVYCSSAIAVPIFNITTDHNQISVVKNNTATIVYNIHNNSGIDMPDMQYFPPPLTKITTGTTCENFLAKNENCSIALLFTAPTILGELLLGPLGVCGHAGACSVTNVDNRVNVTVKALISIAATPPTATVLNGRKQQYTATGTYSDGSTQDITRQVSWQSSDTGVAIINPGPGATGGLATAVAAAGISYITALLDAVTSNTAGLIAAGAALESIAITPMSATVVNGHTQQYTAIGTYSDGSTQDITQQASWQSSDTGVAIIITGPGAAGGLAGAVAAAGTSDITASLGAVISNTAVLTAAPPILNSIAITPTNTTVADGYTQQFTAVGTYSDSSMLDITQWVSWQSSDTSVAIINPGPGATGGLATAVAITGTSDITASQGAVISNTAVLTATAPTLNSIAVTPLSVTVANGHTQQYTAMGTYSDGSTQDITQQVSWQSSDTGVAIINPGPGATGGLATAVTITGTSDITASLGAVTSNAAVLTAGNLAFIANSGGNNVFLCTVNNLTGMFSNCKNTGGAGFNNPTGITLNSNRTLAFVANSVTTNSQVTVCMVNITTGVFSGCFNTGSGFNTVNSIGFNAAETLAFMTNTNANSVSVCDVNLSTGAFSNCRYTNGTGFNGPREIALNSAGTLAFVANQNSNIVSVCDVNLSTGAFSNCRNTNGTGFSVPLGVTLNASGTLAFVTNSATNTVSVCSVTPSTGAFSGCTSTGGTGFNNPHQSSFNSTLTLAFVTNYNGNTVSVCTVNASTGAFTACFTTGTGLNRPFGIKLLNL